MNNFDYDKDVFAPLSGVTAIAIFLLVIIGLMVDIYIISSLNEKNVKFQKEHDEQINDFFYKLSIATWIILSLCVIMFILSLFTKECENKIGKTAIYFAIIVIIQIIFLILFWKQKNWVYDFKKLITIVHILYSIFMFPAIIAIFAVANACSGGK